MKENTKVTNTKNFYKHGMITFIEAIRMILEILERAEISSEEAEKAIKYISRIKIRAH